MPGIQISILPTAPVLSGAELVPLVTVGHISGITQAANAVVTLNDTTGVNPFSVNQQIYIAGVAGMTQINGLGAVVSAVGGVSGAWTATLPINSSAFGAYTSGGLMTTTVNIPLLSMRLSAGSYNPTFLSGNLQYAGPGGTIAGDNDFIVGKAIPNPSGTPGPCALWGSGGGSGVNVSFWHITDEAFDINTPGNDIGWTAGEVQPNSNQRGGNTWKIAGAADLGTGGTDTNQGGTSARGPGGIEVTQGGGNTDGSHPPGDNFQIGGETGSQGANNHTIMTQVNGVSGVNRERVNSTSIRDKLLDGSIYEYGSNGFGSPISPYISRGAGHAAGWPGAGDGLLTATVPLAKLTPTGTQGSISFVNGLALATGYVAPT